MAAIHQNSQLDRPRSSEVHQAVEGCADAASGEEHIVHQDDALVGERKRDVRACDLGMIGTTSQIITVERDIDHSQRHALALDGVDFLHQSLREIDSARPDTDEHQILTASVAFQNFMGDTRQGAVDRHLVHDFRFQLRRCHSLRPYAKKNLLTRDKEVYEVSTCS
jgi:hypothetical protein